jgi:hypothetical protein
MDEEILKEEDEERKLVESERKKTIFKKTAEKIVNNPDWQEKKIHEKIHFIFIESV